LGSNPELKAQYHQFMTEYEELGHTELAMPQSERQASTPFLAKRCLNELADDNQ
jgi:hypothetical protein